MVPPCFEVKFRWLAVAKGQHDGSEYGATIAIGEVSVSVCMCSQFARWITSCLRTQDDGYSILEGHVGVVDSRTGATVVLVTQGDTTAGQLFADEYEDYDVLEFSREVTGVCVCVTGVTPRGARGR